MDFDISNIVSIVSGGGLVLILSQYIFSRLIHQVDCIANKVAKLEIIQAKIIERIDKIGRIENDMDSANGRIIRLETIIENGKH